MTCKHKTVINSGGTNEKSSCLICKEIFQIDLNKYKKVRKFGLCSYLFVRVQP